jgi:hypothetical protein
MPWSITKKNMGAETRNSGATQAADNGGHRHSGLPVNLKE